MTDLNSKYRPRSFDDVLGQGHVTDFLRGLIQNGQLCTTLLITGPVGTGKTTLARIYGQALNCVAPTARGDPCDKCHQCVKFRAWEHSDYRELDCAADPTGPRFDSYVETLRHPPLMGERRLLVLDEAQQLKRNSFDALLKPLEQKRPDTAVAILTVDDEKIPKALQSRCKKFRLRPLTATVSLHLLQKVCNAERIQHEDEALRLIVALSQGHARSLLTNLDQAWGLGDVTVDNAQRALVLGHGETIARYLLAVLDRDYEKQMQLMTDWLPEQPLEKLEIIREFLLFIYNDRIRRKLVPTRADFLSVRDELRDQIVQHFLARAAKWDIPLEEFWHDIMGFWSQVPQTATDVVLLTYVARFDYLINAEPQKQVAETNVRKPSGRRDNPTSLGPRSRFRRAKQPSASAAAATNRGEFLTDKQVRKLIDGSSVLTQASGKLLNMRMTLNFSRLGIDQQPRGARLLGETIGELRMRLKTLENGNDHFHWLYVHEYDAAAGHSCQFVAYIPEQYEAVVEAYLRERIGYKARRSVPDDALLLEMPSAGAPSSHIGGRAAGRPHRGPTRRKQLRRHWGYVRLLCRGLDPSIVIAREPLIKRLAVPKASWRPAGLIHTRRFAVSTTINDGEIRRSAQELLPYLSAFGDQFWSRLGDGWELDEFRDREEVKRERRLAEEDIETTYWNDAGRRKSELADLRRSWPIDPHARPRSWTVWW